VAHPLLPTLLASLEVFRISVTRPGFEKLLVLFIGWVRTAGTHAVTETLVVTGVAGKRHHEAFHRFFSRGTWSPDSFGLWLFHRIQTLLEPEAPVRVAIDDTLAPKKGQHVFGLGSHIDPVRSTVARKVFCFGHCWVVLALVLPVPLCRCTFALPILFRLYTNKKACAKKGLAYRKKTELAAELIRVFVGWTGTRRVELAVDSGYANETVIKDLPATVVLFGAMRPDAVLTGAPAAPSRHRNGRPRVRGEVLPKPEALAKDDTQPWLTCEADLYGRSKTVYYKTLVGQWYQACGVRLLRIVVVRVDTGRIGLRVFFCTDGTIGIRQLLEGYAGRWTIEVCFRNLKQLFGFADSSARTRAAVERTAPFVGFMYSMLIVWFFQHAHATSTALPPVRPWYSHKRGVAFADILRAAQRVLANVEVLDLLKLHKDLHETPPPMPTPTTRHEASRRTSKAGAGRHRQRLAA
jgi:hypothetical protein